MQQHISGKTSLLYRGTVDGYKRVTFITKCGGKGPLIMICKTNHNNICGGYYCQSLTDLNCRFVKGDGTSFVFKLADQQSIHKCVREEG